MSRYVADDGTVCQDKEEMERINARIEKFLLPDKIRKVFGFLRTVEQAEWFAFNVAKRNIGIKRDQLGMKVFE